MINKTYPSIQINNPMLGDNKKKTNPIKIILIIILLALLITGSVFGVISLIKNHSRAYHIEDFQGTTYHIIDNDYRGDYDLQYLNINLDDDTLYDEAHMEPTYESSTNCVDKSNCIKILDNGDEDEEEYDIDDYEDDDTDYYMNIAEIFDYQSYKDFCAHWNFKQKYTDTNKQYAVFSVVSYGSTKVEARLSNVSIDGDVIVFYVWHSFEGDNDNSAAVYFIVTPIKSGTATTVTDVLLYNQAQFETIKKDLTDNTVYQYSEPTEPLIENGN